MRLIIDFSLIQTAGEFHHALAQTLEFPDWYGHNLDALYDCLTELPETVHLILKNWNIATAFSEGFENVFQNAQADNPDFTVEYA